ncbi:DNA polymerase I [Brevibacterium litoralis]|uniref:DNA polymerase I n=1 Tax=Brevibacterium litoralis TaxID=3138935 RepID=UPI0032ECB960
MSTEKILLIDGHSLAYRAYHALPPENFATSTGQTTNAVFGFVSMLVKALGDERPTHLAVAFDLGRQTFRLEEYAEYKAGRAKTPEDFHGQVELMKEVLGALGVPVVTREGFEADDVLATLAARGAEAGLDTYVVTGDKDSFQLSREGVTILYPKRGLSDLTRMTPEAVEEKYGVTPANYRGLAALVGEKADNLPGVPGVGDKTAAKWLTKYGDLPGVLENAADIGGKVGEKLRAHVEDVERNYRLNRLIDDLELPVELEDARFGGHIDHEALGTLLDRLEFQQLGTRLEKLFGELGLDSAPAAAARAADIELPTPRIVTVPEAFDWLSGTDADAWLGLETDARFERGTGAVDVLALARGEECVGIELGEATEDDLARLGEELSRVPGLVMHDAKRQVKALRQVAGGLRVRPAVDTELAAYLLVPDARGYELDDLSQRHLGVVPTAPEAPEEGALDLRGPEAVAEGAALRAWAIAHLAPVLLEKVTESGGTQVLRDIEMPIQQVLVEMELAGIAVDSPALQALKEEFDQRAEAARQAAYESIGHEVNLGSPKQLQTVLYEELELADAAKKAGIKKTKSGGYTTNAAALTALYATSGHPFLENLLAHRDVTKLAQTVVGLQGTVAEDGRIHTSYEQTVAATGRLSSKDPNLQNIPVRTEAGRRIREVFVPEGDAGFSDLLTADYSQIEMRIMAHLSGDEGLIAAFNAGEDLHSYVGAQVFGVGTDEVTGEMRSKVKAMSYGLVYGLSSYGLSQQLGISNAEAKGLMEGYFERFGAVKTYLDEVVEQARSVGYTETMYGRRRYLPQLTSSNRQERDMAERAALNAPIQGSAADIMKIAMLAVDAGLREADVKSRLLLQVHDEVVVELAPGEYDTVTEILRERMGNAAKLQVPLDVNVGHGATWHAAAH